MTGESSSLGRAELVRDARRQEPLAFLGLLAVVAGWTGVSEDLIGLTGAAKWLAAGGYAAIFAVALLAQRLHPGLRARAEQGYRVQYALREHIDPGPELREKVDRQAGYLARIVWFRWWLVPFVPAVVLLGARWDRPLVTVPSALLLVAGTVAWALVMRRLYAAAARWVGDPPGPAREMPAPRPWERWVSGWSFVWALLTILVLGLVTGVVLTLSVGD